MKKHLALLLVLSLCLFNASAQQIRYEKSLEKAENLSREQNKTLCILVSFTPPPQITNVPNGFNSPEVIRKFNENFINFKIDRRDPASAGIVRKYRLSTFPVLIFIDGKGGLMFKKSGNRPPPLLVSIADEAISQSKEKSMVDFDAEFKAGTSDNRFLQEYINKRIKAGLTDNAQLIEKYVNNLGIKDLENYDEVLFILKAGPLSDGRAYMLINTNRKLIDSVYKKEPLDVRVAINNRIISNTMASAIAEKNPRRAQAAAYFTSNTWAREDMMQGQKNSGAKMLQYYKAVKDSTNYLRTAAQHYDRFYMNISVDSIQRMDKKNQERARAWARQQAMLNTPAGGGKTSVSYTFTANNFATELNNAAYSIFTTGTKNLQYLTKALLWSKRSIELNPSAGSYDTLSHLLYRLGFYEEATTTQLKAIELGKVQKRDVKHLQDELTKIKNRTL